MDFVAVGVPVVTGPAQGWNFWPLVAVPLAMLIAFRWLHLPPRIWLVVVMVLAGLASADAVSAWGVAPVSIVVVSLALGASLALRSLHRDDPPTV
jgi:hypothetical protein